MLNAGYVVFEAIFGFLGHSLALVADAGHNLSDVLGLFLAWCAGAMAKTPTKKAGRTPRHVNSGGIV